MTLTDKFTPIVNEIKENRSFLLATHRNPEGDAIGSELALGIALTNLGKKAIMFNHDPVPNALRFLPYYQEISQNFPSLEDVDCVIVLDSSDLPLIGEEYKRITGKKIINIDHHPSNQSFGFINYIDPTASATGEIIYNLLLNRPFTIDSDIAINLYTAILTDTGSFRYSNTTPASLLAAADLLARGVDPRMVSDYIYERQEVGRLRLLQRVLETLDLSKNGKIASVMASMNMLKETGTTSDLMDGFINYPLSVEGVEIALFFKEISPYYYKVSLRSKGEINVGKIASKLGGGGHDHASGVSLKGDLRTVKANIFNAIAKA